MPGFMAPLPMVWSRGLAAPANVICMPCVHMHAYAPTCMNISTCIPTSTYACMAYAYRHLHAWHACSSICMRGMHAYMHICMPHPCAPPPHIIPQGGRGNMTMYDSLMRWILLASSYSTPHPTGGGALPGEPLPWGAYK